MQSASDLGWSKSATVRAGLTARRASRDAVEMDIDIALRRICRGFVT